MKKNFKNAVGAGINLSSKVVKGSMLTMVIAAATGLILSLTLDVIEIKEKKKYNK